MKFKKLMEAFKINKKAEIDKMFGSWLNKLKKLHVDEFELDITEDNYRDAYGAFKLVGTKLNVPEYMKMYEKKDYNSIEIMIPTHPIKKSIPISIVISFDYNSPEKSLVYIIEIGGETSRWTKRLIGIGETLTNELINSDLEKLINSYYDEPLISLPNAL